MNVLYLTRNASGTVCVHCSVFTCLVISCAAVFLVRVGEKKSALGCQNGNAFVSKKSHVGSETVYFFYFTQNSQSSSAGYLATLQSGGGGRI